MKITIGDLIKKLETSKALNCKHRWERSYSMTFKDPDAPIGEKKIQYEVRQYCYRCFLIGNKIDDECHPNAGDFEIILNEI